MSADRPDIFAEPGDDPNLEPWEQPEEPGANCWDARPEAGDLGQWMADDYGAIPPIITDPEIRVTVDLDELLPKLEPGPAADLLDRYEREARQALAAAGFDSLEAVWRAIWTDGARLGGDRVSWATWEYRGLVVAVEDVRRMMRQGVGQGLYCQFARLGELRQRAANRAVEPDVLHVRKTRKTGGAKSAKKQSAAAAAHDEKYRPLYQKNVDDLRRQGRTYDEAVTLTAEHFRRKHPDPNGRTRSRHSIDRVRNLTKR